MRNYLLMAEHKHQLLSRAYLRCSIILRSIRVFVGSTHTHTHTQDEKNQVCRKDRN